MKKANTNYYTNTNEFESKEYTGQKLVLSKVDFELYDEQKNIAQKVFRIKRIGLPNKAEKWKVIVDDKVIFIVDGMKISKKERTYLRTLDGVQFLISWAKSGIGPMSELKMKLKKELK